MKMLVVWSWAPKDSIEVTKRFIDWKPPVEIDALYPMSTMIGMNKAFMVVNADNMADMQKNVAQWTDLCTFKFIPIMESREAVAVSME